MKFEKFNRMDSRTKNGFILFALMAVVVLLIGAAEVAHRIDVAQNLLTVNDLKICLDEIDSQNYAECLIYLNETNQKDLSAFWTGGAT